MSSTNESSTEYESDDGSISTNNPEEIRDVSKIHPEINARDAKSKIRERIKQTLNKWKGS